MSCPKPRTKETNCKGRDILVSGRIRENFKVFNVFLCYSAFVINKNVRKNQHFDILHKKLSNPWKAYLPFHYSFKHYINSSVFHRYWNKNGKGKTLYGSVATNPLALRWMCGSPHMACTRRTTQYICGAKKQQKWSRHVNSIVPCCHSAKLCAHAARAFRASYP